MKRREFIMLIGGTAAWSRAAHAQLQALPTIGFLSARSPDESAHLVEAFRRGLAEPHRVPSKAEMLQSNIAGRWASMTDCRCWQPNSYSGPLPHSLRSAAKIPP